MGSNKCSYIVLLVFLVLLIQSSLETCDLTTHSLNKQYTINSWTGNWTFENYVTGPSSGNYYYLLSSSSESQCGIIKEDSSGNQLWAKTYTNGQCSQLKILSNETSILFTSAFTAHFAYAIVNSTDGSLSNYYGYSEFTQDEKASGLVLDESNSNITITSTAGTSGTGPSSKLIQGVPGQITILGGDFTRASFTKILQLNNWDIEIYWYIALNNNPGYEIHLYNGTVSKTLSMWSYNISCTSTCPSSDYAKSDHDQTNVHVAISVPSEYHALVMVLAIADGTSVGSLKSTQSSQQLVLGSLVADSNSITWISMYSNSSSYSELIKYDSSNNNFTNYQQTGYSYSYQSVDPSSNDKWFALTPTQHISNTELALMNLTSGLTVSTSTTSGLADTSAYTLGGSYQDNVFTPVANFLSPNSSITSSASDMNYTKVDTCNNETSTSNQTNSNNQTNDDDGLSTGEIIGVVLGSIFGLILLLVIAFVIIYICNKNMKKNTGHQQVKTDAEAEGQVEKSIDNQAIETHGPQKNIGANQV